MSHINIELEEALKRGYAEMSEINSKLAEEGIYEQSGIRGSIDNLTECE